MRVFPPDKGSPEPTIPRYLYKFRSARRAIEIVEQEKLHMEQLGSLNDFHECRLLLPEPIKEQEQDVEERVSDTSRILCLSGSEALNSELMWAFYADNHCGVCLQFDMDIWDIRGNDASCIIRDVHYPTPPERKSGPWDRGAMEKTDPLIEMLFTKNDCWRHEDEWRVLRVHKWPDPADAYLSYPPGSLKSIIFGSRISPQDETSIRDLPCLSANDVQFKRVKLTDNNYSFAIEPAYP